MYLFYLDYNYFIMRLSVFLTDNELYYTNENEINIHKINFYAIIFYLVRGAAG